MHKRHLFLVTIAAVGIFAASAHADPATTKATAQSLLQEGTVLDNKKAELDKLGGEVSSLEINLKARNMVVTNNEIILKAEKAKIDNDVAAVVPKIQAFQSYCQGTYEEEEYQRRLAKCNADQPVIQKEFNRVRDESQTWAKRDSEARAERNAISGDTLAWAAKQKKYNADSADYETKRQDWMRRTKLLFSSSALEDLKKRNKISVGCAEINEPIAAQTCLKQVWDGARSTQ